jgi:hypothetical protein
VFLEHSGHFEEPEAFAETVVKFVASCTDQARWSRSCDDTK